MVDTLGNTAYLIKRAKTVLDRTARLFRAEPYRMSIVACVKVYDGIVLGAESMTQLYAEIAPGKAEPVKAFSNARKLFQIAKLPVGVVTYGGGNIGKRSVESFLNEFSESYLEKKPKDCSVEEIAKNLLNFIRGSYEKEHSEIPPDQRPVIGFLLAGYSAGKHLGSEWEFVLPKNNAPVQPRAEDQFGASWRGVSVPFTRLHFGVDPRLGYILEQEGVPPDVIDKVGQAALKLKAQVIFDGMPVQDAIGFCRFILETTIGQATYELGSPSCGGPVHLAVITRADGFVWVSAPRYTL